MKSTISEVRISVPEHNMSFNSKMTMWFGVYPITEMRSRVHKNFTLEKVGRIKDRVRCVTSKEA